MITTYRLNTKDKKLYCTNRDMEIFTIPLKSFLKYMPFQWDGDIRVFDYPSLKGLFIDILNEIRVDTPDAFTRKFFTINYSYNGEPKETKHNNWMDARRSYIRMIKSRDIYSNIVTNFNPDLR